MKKWLATNPDGKLPTNQKIEGYEDPHNTSRTHSSPSNRKLTPVFFAENLKPKKITLSKVICFRSVITILNFKA
jgi:hypothetical protein